MNYGLAYAVGFHPWEDLAEHRPFADKLLELVAAKRAGAPAGRPSTSGPAAAAWGVELAKRGWNVTGVDSSRRPSAGRGSGSMRRAWRCAWSMATSRRCGRRASAPASASSSTRARSTVLPRPACDDGREVTAVAGSGRHPDPRLLRAAAPRSAPPGREPRRRRARLPRAGHSGVEVADSEPDPLARVFRFDERFYSLRRR